MSFKKAVKNAMKGGKLNKKEASAAVAEASRNASPAAKAANPNLKKVKGFSKTASKAKAKSKGRKC